MILIIDNYDSFTHNLAHRTPGEVRVVRNDAATMEQVHEMAPDGIILGPGPGHPANARDVGICDQILRADLSTPVLGVCLGMQAMAHVTGAAVHRAPRIVHGESSSVKLADHPLFDGVASPTDVGRYHSLSVEEAPGWDILGTADGMVMAMAHPNKPWIGVQFHPESILTPDGARMLQNFASMVRA